MSSLDFYHIAKSIKQVTDAYHAPLIINDRVDVALAVDAAGVHIGQSDLPAEIVHSIIGSDKILGVSASTLDEAIQAKESGADYLGIGAMFSTKTKTDVELVSMEELEKIRNSVRLPLVLIGGINLETLSHFKGMGIDGIAVISALISAKDITKEAKKLKKRFRNCKG